MVADLHLGLIGTTAGFLFPGELSGVGALTSQGWFGKLEPTRAGKLEPRGHDCNVEWGKPCVRTTWGDSMEQHSCVPAGHLA